jgi:hypothetical protein
MFFIALTFLAAFAIEGLGTYVSVIGLSTLFGANPIIIALAVALDAGKVVVVTLLYSYWNKLGRIMKAYALFAATVTMIITSAGAAGYLSGEFQKAIVGTQEIALKVDVLKGQIAKYEERKKQIDQQISALPEKTTVAQRIRLINAFKSEQKDLQDKINAIDRELPNMQVQQISVEAKAGPILYIAKAFDIPVESAVKWVILMIIFVFDPLAVFLIIAGNFLMHQRKIHKDVDISDADLFDDRLDEKLAKFDAQKHGGEFPHLPEPSKIPPMPLVRAAAPEPVVAEAPVSSPTQDTSPPIFEVLHATPASPEVVQEPAQTVLFNSPDTSETKTYTEQDLIDLGASPETMRLAGFEPPLEPAREVITREQLVPTTHFPAVSSLNAVKADDSVVFDENPRAQAKSFFQNLK